MATSHLQWRQLLVVAVALALVLFVGSADAWNQCRKGFKDCYGRPGDCETCIDKDVNNCGKCHYKCPTGNNAYPICYNGYCKLKCKPGFADCNGKDGCEVCTSNDPKNCGCCGNVCKSGKCKDSKCVKAPCPPGWSYCKNGCKNLNKDNYNCGHCGYKCPCSLKFGEAICKWGKCYEQCKSGWKYDGRKKCCVQGY